MTEAYEVGVRLALHDGVSVGLHAARRELQAVNTAMGVSTVSLQRLQRAGSDALTGARNLALPRPRSTKPPVERASEAVSARSEPRARSRPDAVSARSEPKVRPRPESTSARPEPKARPRPDALSAPSEPRARPRPYAVVSSPPVRLQGEAAQPSCGVVAPVPAVADPRYRPLVAAPPPISPTVLPGSAADTAPPVSPPVAVAREQAARPSSAATAKVQEPARLNLAPRTAGASAPVPTAPMRVAPDLRDGGPTAAEGTAGAATMPTAPGNFSPAAPANASAARPMAPQSGSAPSAAPMGGDVYLDGALMGRWVSRHLEREAARPQAGPTGFDARRHPILPGAAVGGI